MLSPHHPLQLVLGLIIWSLFFVVIYSGLSVGCAFSPPSPDQGALNWINFSVLLVTLVTLLVLLASAYHCWRSRQVSMSGENDDQHKARRFIAGIAASEYLLAAAATLVVGLPAVYLPPCL